METIKKKVQIRIKAWIGYKPEWLW